MRDMGVGVGEGEAQGEGQGGCLATDDAELARLMWTLREDSSIRREIHKS